MKKLLTIAMLAVLFCSCEQSKRISHLTVPDEVNKQRREFAPLEPVNVDSVMAVYPGHDGVYLNMERTIEHAGNKDGNLATFLFGDRSTSWSYIDIKRYRYVVMNPEAAWLTQVEFYSKPHKLYMIVINPDSTERHYGLANLKEEKNGDEKSYRFIFPDIRRGSTIEVGREYTYAVKEHLPPLEYDIELQFEIPCEKLDFSFAYPDWWRMDFKNTGPYSTSEYDRREDTEARKIIISHSATDVPAILREPFCPYFNDVCKRLEFKVNWLSMGGGEIDLTTRWQDIAETVYEKAIKPTKKLKGKTDIANLAKELTEGEFSDYDKLKAIVSYVQDSLELTWSWGKADYHKIIKQKKGGYLQLTGLTYAMLQHLEIPSCMLMVHSADDGYFDETYVSYGEVPMPAVKVEINDDYYVIFPYIKGLPLNHTPQNFQGQQALAIDPKGVGTFWTVPPGNRADNTVEESYILTLGDDGVISVEETKTFSGSQAYYLRELLSELTDSEREKTVREFLTYSDGEVDLEAPRIESLDNPDEPLVLNLKYTISNLLTITPEEVIFHTGGLFSPISGNRYKFDPDYRQLPIAIYYDEQFNKKIDINFPAGWQITNELGNVSLENAFGAISGQYTASDGQLHIEQKLALNRSIEPKEQYPELLNLVGDPSLLHVPSIVFSTTGAAN